MPHARQRKGFTLIELLLVIALIGLIAAVAMVGLKTGPQKRLDLKRVSDIDQLQKALGVYVASQKAFPILTGCVDGTTDLVSTELHAKNALAAGTIIKDPSFPTDVSQCYYYTSATGSTYSLRYTLQTNSSAGTIGNHTVQP